MCKSNKIAFNYAQAQSRLGDRSGSVAFFSREECISLCFAGVFIWFLNLDKDIYDQFKLAEAVNFCQCHARRPIRGTNDGGVNYN